MRTCSRTSCPFVCHCVQIARGPVVSGGAKIHRDSGRLTETPSTQLGGSRHLCRGEATEGQLLWDHPDPVSKPPRMLHKQAYQMHRLLR